MPTNETIFLLIVPTSESDSVHSSIISCVWRRGGIPVAHVGWRIMAERTELHVERRNHSERVS